MTHIESNERALVFELHAREQQILEFILSVYPAVPQSYQAGAANTGADNAAECERLLQEALAAQRETNKRQLDQWRAAPERFARADRGAVRLTLDRLDVEWFMQVLNDVRVGMWLRLGEPESGEIDDENVRPDQMPQWLAMEMSAYFQMHLLEALNPSP